MNEGTDVLILGAGLSGLAAASVLGDRAIVLERESRPGGLVRTERFGDYWFDHVIHLLYFPDPDTAGRVRGMVGDDLKPCVPEAWVECQAGTVLFPFQMHLGGLRPEVVVRCISDLAKVTYGSAQAPPADFEQLLLSTFGEGMCDAFLMPYNRKMWKRPLSTLAAEGFTWNITRPDFEAVLRGVVCPAGRFNAYNSAGWYPRPAADAPLRGMELLSRALARQAANLRLGHVVEEIDLEERSVVACSGGKRRTFTYERACLSTLPLPALLSRCRQTPSELLRACRSLVFNRVLSVALSIRGPRPTARGHWRYYSDEALIFTRLIYQHEFDPDMAPADGWGLLVEITEPGEQPPRSAAELFARVRADVSAAGVLPEGCQIIDEHVIAVEPAYVVFTADTRALVEEAHAFLRRYGVSSIGRYGAWEYSSMGQVMRDGFRCAENLAKARAEPAEVAATAGQ